MNSVSVITPFVNSMYNHKMVRILKTVKEAVFNGNIFRVTFLFLIPGKSLMLCIKVPDCIGKGPF